MKKEGVITMSRLSIIFILLELFTVRNYKRYDKRIISEMREIVFRSLKSYDEYNVDVSFYNYLLVQTLLCSNDVYKCMRSFVNYMKRVDKIL